MIWAASPRTWTRTSPTPSSRLPARSRSPRGTRRTSKTMSPRSALAMARTVNSGTSTQPGMTTLSAISETTGQPLTTMGNGRASATRSGVATSTTRWKPANKRLSPPDQARQSTPSLQPRLDGLSLRKRLAPAKSIPRQLAALVRRTGGRAGQGRLTVSSAPTNNRQPQQYA